MAATHLDIGLRCIKYLLFAVNSLFVLTGVMIISVGTTIYAVYENFSHFLDPSYFSPATLLIVVGIFIFIIAFMGCCGALKESTCMVLVFAVLLSFVLVLELAAAIAAYALQDGIKDLLADSCCTYWSDDFDSPERFCRVYEEGCICRLSIIIHRSALYIGTGAVAIALIQLSGIMFACMLGRAIRRQKTERERRRWELRENLVNGYEPLGKSDPFTTFPVVYMSPDYPLKGDQKC